jgi:hypothetical protein
LVLVSSADILNRTVKPNPDSDLLAVVPVPLAEAATWVAQVVLLLLPVVMEAIKLSVAVVAWVVACLVAVVARSMSLTFVPTIPFPLLPFWGTLCVNDVYSSHTLSAGRI